MRRLLTLCVLALAVSATASNLPSKINFQGKLLDPATNEPRDGTFTMTLRLYGAPTGGAALYTETQTAVPVSNGVFSIQIGSVATLTPELFKGASAYLSVQVSPDALEMSPRQQLNMSAYAFTAAQLAADGTAMVRVDNAYSTFTAAGNLLLAAGVQGSSASFVNGVTASSGTFFATGASQYSLQTSSGLLVGGGTLRAAGAGGVSVRYGVNASTFSGEGADLTAVRPDVSSDTANNLFTATSGVEILVSSTVISPARTDSRFIVFATVGINRAANNLTSWQIRVRRNVGGACTTGSTQVGFTNVHTVTNTAGISNTVTIFKVDAPTIPSVPTTIWYCLTLNSPTANQTSDERTMAVMELAP